MAATVRKAWLIANAVASVSSMTHSPACRRVEISMNLMVASVTAWLLLTAQRTIRPDASRTAGTREVRVFLNGPHVGVNHLRVRFAVV